MSDETAQLDATAQAELVRSGEASPTELVEAAIARAEALNPELNAIIHPLYEQGLREAEDPPDGPFRGVPFLFKDLGAAMAGQPLHMGCRALKAIDLHAPVDSYIGARFREAGLVTIGKTNTPEFGTVPLTEPDAYGPTHNPWDPALSPGGSSGGSAAAVAAGIVPIAHANDGGGSIRIPASCCGLVGLKPTRQRTSLGPMVGEIIGGLAVELAVARSVRDVAAVLDAVEGYVAGDPYAAPPPARPYVEELTADPRRLRIAVATEPFMAEAAGVTVDPVVVGAVRDAAELLEGLGHAVDADVPAAVEGPDPLDAFMTRWYAGEAGILASLEPILGREPVADDVEPATWAMVEEGRKLSAAEYMGIIALHQLVGRALAAWFEAGHDLLLTPTMTAPPSRIGQFGPSPDDPLAGARGAWETGAFTALPNATGNPSVSLPLHWSREGIPIGVQLIAPFGAEDALIGVAAQLEQARPWADRRPPIFAGAGS